MNPAVMDSADTAAVLISWLNTGDYIGSSHMTTDIIKLRRISLRDLKCGNDFTFHCWDQGRSPMKVLEDS